MRRPAPIALLATIALACVALAGCASSKITPPSETPTIPEATAANDSNSTFPATADGLTLAARPSRIVSLSPTATDMLFAIGAGAQVVAVDKNSDYFGTPAPAAWRKYSGSWSTFRKSGGAATIAAQAPSPRAWPISSSVVSLSAAP